MLGIDFIPCIIAAKTYVSIAVSTYYRRWGVHIDTITKIQDHQIPSGLCSIHHIL